MRNKFTSPVSLLFMGSLALRLIVYLMLPASDDFGKYSNSSPLYFSALTEHLGDYLAFTTNIPPATFIIDAFVLSVTGAKTAMGIRAFLILVCMLDTIAIVLLYKSARRLGSGERTAFLVLCLFSLALVPYELWRDGMHYDQLTLFFTCLFVWALVKLIKKESSLTNSLLVSLTGALLVSQSAASSAIVPFSVLLILCLVYLPKKQFRKLGYAAILCLFLPLFVLFLISEKNQNQGQESLTSNKAGPAMMMVVQRAYRYDASGIRQFAQQSGAPAWWLWAYDHATPPVDSLTGKPSEGWLNLAQAFGICFYTANGKANHNPWQFDFIPLTQYVQTNGPAGLLPVVQADAADAVNKPYRFAGFSPELSPRWIGVYGNVSKKIFFTAIQKNPLGMARAFIEQQSIFALYGPLFLYNTTQSKPSLLARSGLQTLPGKLPLSFLFVPATVFFACMAFITYAIVLLRIPLLMGRRLQNIRPGKKVPVMDPFLLLSIPVLCIAAVYSCLVGGENDRYFVQAAPYIVLLASYLPARGEHRKSTGNLC